MKKYRIFCAFQFFNEIEILKIKLEELWNVVDYFVISESDHTHSGKPKPYYLIQYMNQNKDFTNKYRSKILWQGLDDTPSNYINLNYINDYWYDHVVDKINAQTHWSKNVESYGRDSWEKESLIREIGRFAHDDDIVILGDCDEIPKADNLQYIINNINIDEHVHLQHDFYWYYMNLLKIDELWYGNIVTSFKKFKENSFCTMRQERMGLRSETLSGWHFTYMGGAERVKQKIESWGEQSLNQDYVKDNVKENIEKSLTLERDIFFRPAKFKKVEITYNTHPKFLVENQEKYDDFILK